MTQTSPPSEFVLPPSPPTTPLTPTPRSVVYTRSCNTYVGGLSVHKDVYHSTMVDATIKNRVLYLQRLLIIHVPAWERDELQRSKMFSFSPSHPTHIRPSRPDHVCPPARNEKFITQHFLYNSICISTHLSYFFSVGVSQNVLNIVKLH